MSATDASVAQVDAPEPADDAGHPAAAGDDGRVDWLGQWDPRRRHGGRSVPRAPAAGFAYDHTLPERQRRWAEAALTGWTETMAGTPEGQRNGTLNDAGMR